MNKLIGIAGKAGSGKDTVASIIDSDFSWGSGDFVVSRFASGIYVAVGEWLQLPSSYFNRDLKELPLPLYLTGDMASSNFTKLLPIMKTIACPPTDKTKLSSCVLGIYNYFWNSQQFITDNGDKFVLVSPREILQLFNKFTEEVNSSFWVNVAERDNYANENVIFADVRTPTEAKFIKDSGGLLIYVERDTTDIPLSNHVSESYQKYLKDNAHTVIINNGTLDDLRTEVYEIIEDFLIDLKRSNNKQLELQF